MVWVCFFIVVQCLKLEATHRKTLNGNLIKDLLYVDVCVLCAVYACLFRECLWTVKTVPVFYVNEEKPFLKFSRYENIARDRFIIGYKHIRDTFSHFLALHLKMRSKEHTHIIEMFRTYENTHFEHKHHPQYNKMCSVHILIFKMPFFYR